MQLQGTHSSGAINVTFERDEWEAIRYAALMFADVAGQAPTMVGTVTRSQAMQGRRRAYRLRDEVAKISNDLGLNEL